MKKNIGYMSFIFLLAITLLLPGFVFADMGMIRPDPQVKLYETDQNAIVAWNGQEEMLILSINLRSNQEGSKVLTILPLPSNPLEIKEDSIDTFKKLTDLINQKLPLIAAVSATGSQDAKNNASLVAELTFHEQIGAHDVSIVKINNLDGFNQWELLPQIGIKPEQIDASFKSALQNYMKRGLIYFSFDTIEVGTKDISLNPIRYYFKSDYFYYPIKLTAFSATAENAESINDAIHLFTINTNPIKDSINILKYRYPLWSHNDNISISLQELQNVSSNIASLFSFETNVYVTEFRYSGSLAKTTDDIIIYPKDIWKNNLKVGVRSEDTLALQKILINENLWDSSSNATGYFGSATKQAVIKFQEEYRSYILDPLNLTKGTGFVGPYTRNFLKNFQMQ
ncbi:MAG: DUF2330 domain-containing protein [Candidatus Parcubacteria bacterium]|nr:DUF2330 domain-containing protein [Candidatus Parcubacteria bacterium]